MSKRITLSVMALLFMAQVVCHAQAQRQAAVAIQITSDASNGKYSIPQIIRVAKDNGYQAVVLTDRNIMRWEFGLWPLRNIIKRKVEEKSIATYGIKRYFQEVASLQRIYPEMIIIPGVEAAPFYFWQGSIFSHDFKFNNWDKHVLAIGIEQFEDYAGLPVIGNGRGMYKARSLRSVLGFAIPLLLLCAGILCMRKGSSTQKNTNGVYPGPHLKNSKPLGIGMVLTGLLFLCNNYPYKEAIFDAYHGDLRYYPYQNFINYVDQRGGLTFWSHPEAANNGQIGMVGFETQNSPDELIATRNYTGFTIFYEGYEKTGKPGGVWDKILNDYCEGKRSRPIWAIEGLAFSQSGDLDAILKDLRTVVLVKTLDAASVKDALSNGRVYVSNGSRSGEFTLEKFTISDTVKEFYSGQEALINGPVSIDIIGHFKKNFPKSSLKVNVIKDGFVIREFPVTAPFHIIYNDKEAPRGASRLSYYRIEIVGNGIITVSNPIFVKHRL